MRVSPDLPTPFPASSRERSTEYTPPRWLEIQADRTWANANFESDDILPERHLVFFGLDPDAESLDYAASGGY